QGLVHRDVKPGNLLLAAGGVVKVLDLGLARLCDPDEADPQALTESGQWMGTADYMAPEQGLDPHRVDIRSDLYALGCTFYKLLAGVAPFEGAPAAPFRKALAHATRAVPP